jgi:hypothetical protein
MCPVLEPLPGHAPRSLSNAVISKSSSVSSSRGGSAYIVSIDRDVEGAASRCAAPPALAPPRPSAADRIAVRRVDATSMADEERSVCTHDAGLSMYVVVGGQPHRENGCGTRRDHDLKVEGCLRMALTDTHPWASKFEMLRSAVSEPRRLSRGAG